MNWFTKMLTSSIGQKILMAVTGLFLITFLLVHCFINALIFFNDGGETFNMGAEIMASNWLIRAMEIVLFIGLLLHIVKGLSLLRQNNSARPIKYEYSNAKENSKWYSRSMGLLGTLLLMFLIIHLKHFWIVSRFTDHITSGEETLFEEMVEVFENPMVVLIYVLAMVSLAYHLLHGFKSAFQSLGLNHPRYNAFIHTIGVAYSILIPFIFALMPLAMHFGFIK
ncbi:MAG: succinate dehydrogenase cytochrome b subunit [Bacteroidia bacterium]|jgi:succinate dehydrogenase / fumarate reductase cytochrome b subunit